VFIAGSMIGTVADSTGRFRLQTVPPGPKRLYVSRVGYANESSSLPSQAGSVQVLTIRFPPQVLQSPPVTVSATRDEEWYDRLAYFKRLFIGASAWADRCTLRNPTVLHFEEKWWGRFEARAQRPLIIENRALGYRVEYFLKAFEERGPVVRWDGEPLFTPLDPADSLQAARWRAHRQAAYRGSLRHFLRALRTGRLETAQFDVYRLPRASAFRHTRDASRFPTSRDEILAPGPDSTMLLDTHDRLEVVYRGAPESEAYLNSADQSRRPRDHQTSHIALNEPPIHIDRYGDIVEPYGATLYGYFAFTTRMSHLLPREYEPPE
jgi:hypothetical protein